MIESVSNKHTYALLWVFVTHQSVSETHIRWVIVTTITIIITTITIQQTIII